MDLILAQKTRIQEHLLDLWFIYLISVLLSLINRFVLVVVYNLSIFFLDSSIFLSTFASGFKLFFFFKSSPGSVFKSSHSDSLGGPTVGCEHKSFLKGFRYEISLHMPGWTIPLGNKIVCLGKLEMEDGVSQQEVGEVLSGCQDTQADMLC